MTLLRLCIAACVAFGALGACKNDPPPAAEKTSGAEKVGEDLDEAADEASDEVKHVGNDRDEAVDEADDKVDEASGAD